MADNKNINNLIKAIQGLINKLDKNPVPRSDKGKRRRSELDASLKEYERKAKLELDRASQLSDIHEKGLAQAEAEYKFAQKKLEIESKRIALAYELDDLSEEELNDRKKDYELTLESLSHFETKIELERKHLRIKKEKLEIENAAIENLRETTRLGLKGLFGIDENTIFDQINAVGGLGKAFGIVSNQMKDSMKWSNLLSATIMKFAEQTLLFAMQQDALYSQFLRNTGATREYETVITESYNSSREYGVTIEESTEAMSSLYQEMNDFNLLTKANQEELGNLVSVMAETGIEAGVAAENIDILQKSMGMSIKETKETVREIADLNTVLGSSDAAMRAFVSTAPRLQGYGNDAIEVFKDMAKAAKATGVEMEALIGITQKFDTFEGAADAAANLNAVLGGNLINSTQLLLATEEERVRMLIQTMEMSGKVWTELTRYERQAVATAAGIGDMNQANKIFGQSLSAYEEGKRKAAELADEQKKLEERAKEYQNIQDQLNTLMLQFAISMKPVLEIMRDVLVAVIEFNEWLGGWPVVVVGAQIALFGLLKFFAGIISSMTTLGIVAPPAAAGVSSVGAASATAGPAVGSAGATMAGIVPVLLSFTAAILATGAAIWLAAEGLAGLLEAAKGMSGEGLAALGMLTAMIGAMAVAAMFAGPQMLLLGAALALAGAGIWLAAEGADTLAQAFSLFVNVLVGNLAALVESSLVIYSLAGGITVLSVALGLLGAVAPLALIGLLGFATGMAALALSVALIKTEDLQAIEGIFTGLSKMAELGTDMSDLSHGVDNLVDSLEDLDDFRSSFGAILGNFEIAIFIGMLEHMDTVLERIATKSSRINEALVPLAQVMSNVNQLKDENVVRMERFSKATVDFLQASAESANAKSSEMLDKLITLMGSVNKNTSISAQRKQTPIVVKYDKREVGRMVEGTIDGKKKQFLNKGNR